MVNNERFYQERDRLYDALNAAEPGTDEYQKLLEMLFDFEKLETDKEETRIRESIEQLKIENETLLSEARGKIEVRQNRSKIAVALMGLLATVGIAVMTNKEEEFRAITSKVDQKAKDCIRFIKY